jgi:hypothetical protein
VRPPWKASRVSKGLIISDCWTKFRKVSFSRASLSNSHSHFTT